MTDVIQLEHSVLGDLWVVGAGRADSGRWLLVRNWAGRVAPKGQRCWQKKILIDGGAWWLDDPRIVAEVWQRFWGPIHERELRRLRRSERTDIARRNSLSLEIPATTDADDGIELVPLEAAEHLVEVPSYA